MKKSKVAVCIAIIVSSAGVIFNFGQYFPTLFKENSAGGYYYSHQFDSNERWVNTNNMKEIGLSEEYTPDSVIYSFKKIKDSRVIVSTLWGLPSVDMNTRYAGITSAAIISGPNNAMKDKGIFLKQKIGFSVQELNKNLLEKDNFKILMVKSQPPYPDITLRRIEISILPVNFLVNLPLILFSIFFPLILYFIIEIIFVLSVSRRLFIYVFSSFLVYFILHVYYNFFFSSYIYIMSLSVLSYYLVCKLKGVRAEKIYFFIFLLILLIGVGLRWNELVRVALAIPHPDATSGDRGYRFIADNMHLFTARGFFAATASHHEPFYPFIIKVFFWIFGSSDLHLRFVSFFFSCLAVCFTYLIAREFFKNEAISLLSAALMAFNGLLIEQSTLGLRTEWETCLFLLLFYCCYLKRDKLSLRAWLITTIVISSVWLLTRTLMAPLICFIIAYACFLKKRRLKKIHIFAIYLCIFLPLLPYKINLYKTYGDIFWDSNTYATEAANLEFSGKAGFPKEKVTASEYFTKMHNFKEVVLFHAVGLAGIFNFSVEDLANIIYEENHLIKSYFKEKFLIIKKYPVIFIKVSVSILFCMISLFLILFNNKYRVILYLIFLGTIHNAFGYGVTILKGPLIVTFHRQIAHALPFFAFAVSYSIVLLGTRVKNYIFLKE